jgi:co-chaperonin GroES (HSP10)
MKALKNNIVVTEVEVENKTESGIILQGVAEVGVKAAVVVSLGVNVTGDLAIGDKIAVDWSRALPVTEAGKKLLILSEDSVFAKYEY